MLMVDSESNSSLHTSKTAEPEGIFNQQSKLNHP